MSPQQQEEEKEEHELADQPKNPLISLKDALVAFDVALPESVATAIIILILNSIFKYFKNEQAHFFNMELSNIQISVNGEAKIIMDETMPVLKNIPPDMSSPFPFINHLCVVLYEALDYGVKAGEERALSEEMEHLLTFISSSEEDACQNDFYDASVPDSIYNGILELCGAQFESNGLSAENMESEAAKIIAEYYEKSYDLIRIRKLISMKHKKATSDDTVNEEKSPKNIVEIQKDDISDLEKKIQARKAEKQAEPALKEILKQNQSPKPKVEGKNPDEKSPKEKQSDLDRAKIMSSLDGLIDSQERSLKKLTVKSASEDVLLIKKRRKRRRKKLLINSLSKIDEGNEESGDDDDDETGELSELAGESPKENDSTQNSQQRQTGKRAMKIIELSSIQSKIILADLDIKNASREYIRILNDGLFCVVCHTNKAQEDQLCCVCGFGVCSKHVKTIFLPLRFNVRDNEIHHLEIEKKDIPTHALPHFTQCPICIVCYDLVVAIKTEYIEFLNSKSKSDAE